MAYTTEQLDYLKGSVERQNASFKEITRAFNEEFGTRVTRSAVLGLANRKKWAGRGRPYGRQGVKISKAPTETQALNRILAAKEVRDRGADSGLLKTIKKAPSVAADIEPTESVDLARETIPTRIPMLEALERQCKWPAADDGTASMVCGGRTIARRPYCEHHNDVASGRTKPGHGVFRDNRTARSGQFT